MVCGRAIANVSLDTSKFTLGRFVGSVLKQRLAFVHPMITYDNFMYEEGEDLDEDEVAENAAHLPTALADLPGGGIRHNSSVSVTDQVQDMKVTVVINHQVCHVLRFFSGWLGMAPVAPPRFYLKATHTARCIPLVSHLRADTYALFVVLAEFCGIGVGSSAG
jgi:hypothetical protein